MKKIKFKIYLGHQKSLNYTKMQQFLLLEGHKCEEVEKQFRHPFQHSRAKIKISMILKFCDTLWFFLFLWQGGEGEGGEGKTRDRRKGATMK